MLLYKIASNALKFNKKENPFSFYGKRICRFGWMTGLEPATFGTTIRRSNQLSYNHRVNLRSQKNSANIIQLLTLHNA